MPELFKHQVQTLQFHSSRQNSGDLSDVGVGKTPPMVRGIAESVFEKTLVVCPNSILENWQKEIATWSALSSVILRGDRKKRLELLEKDYAVYIINYEGVPVIFQKLLFKGFEAIIADECFPWETEVLTNVGPLPIGFIVDHCLPVKILSSTPSGDLEFQEIDRYIKTLPRDLVKVGHENGSFICTGNHRIFTEENGYVNARALNNNFSLRALRCGSFEAISAEQEEEVSLLWNFLFGQMENGTTGDSFAGLYGRNQSKDSCLKDWQ